VAEHRLVAEREHRGQAPAVDADLRVPYRVDAGVEAMERAGLGPLLDGARRESTGGKVGEAHDAVLLGGDAGDHHIDAPWAR
jgi:hypothetical protein